MARALGLDFGTTNTVLALSTGGVDTRSMHFESSVGTTDTMRTALSFMKDPLVGAQALKVEAGQAAIRQFIDNPGECRFRQSIKTFAASPLFQAKLVLIALALANAFALRRIDWRGNRSRSRVALAGVASIALWLGAILMGRLVGYLD